MSWPIRFLAAFIVVLCISTADSISASDFGTVGLIKTPSARMAADGHLWATFSREEILDVYNISFRVLLGWKRPSDAVFNPAKFTVIADEERDRSYEVKVKVKDEGDMVATSYYWSKRYSWNWALGGRRNMLWPPRGGFTGFDAWNRMGPPC